MAFCVNCGNKIVDGAKFCFECGTPIVHTERENEGGAKLKKCPGCGASIGSFSTHCPMCGSEIDNIVVASSVKDFVEKLEKISARQMPVRERRPSSKKKSVEDLLIEEEMERARFEEQKDKEKAELIINFPVPNAKEEILEFMLLASSNLDAGKGHLDQVDRAWRAKMDQVYEKARLSMSHTAEFDKVKQIYEGKQKQISEHKRKTRRMLLVFGVLVVAFFGFIFWMINKPASFETLQVKNVTMKIADYWEEDGSKKNVLNYYSDNTDEEKVTFEVKFMAETDKNYDVSFDGLYADNKNMIKALEKMYTDANVLTDEIYESDNGVKGILYTFSLEQSTGWFSSEAAKGYCFVFPSESDRRWFYITMIVVNSESDGSYYKDYMKTLASIQCE